MAAGTLNCNSAGLVKLFVPCSKQIDSADLWMFVIVRKMHVLYPWVSSEHLKPLRSDSRLVSRWCPCLLPLVSVVKGRKGLDSLLIPSCNKPLAKLRLQYGVFESHSNTTKLYHGSCCVELWYNFPFLMPVSKLASCRLEPFSRVLPASNSGALPRNAAW